MYKNEQRLKHAQRLEVLLLHVKLISLVLIMLEMTNYKLEVENMFLEYYISKIAKSSYREGKIKIKKYIGT